MPSYQNASSTEPLAPTQNISMLLGTRETAVIPPSNDALPAGAISSRPQWSMPSYQNASWTEPLAPTQNISMLLGLSLIHISEPTRLGMISYAVFCLKKK